MNVPPGFILTAGPGWIAVDKPPGLSVHNDPQGDALSILRFCLAQDDELSSISKSDGSLSPAHRLDKETSGVLLFATTRESATKLQSAFAESKAKKSYRTIVKGRIEAAGRWTDPLSDKAEGRDNPAGKSDDRKPCETRYEVSKSNAYLTELKIDLGTGRQHQIRKHAAIAKHPVVGDKRYGDAKHAKLMEAKFGVARMFLHAERLSLKTNGFDIEVESVVPADFSRVFEEVPR